MAISTIGASALDSGVSQLGKNLIDNGAMTVAQRGALTGQGGTDAYTALDRLLMNSGSTVARVTTIRHATELTVPAGARGLPSKLTARQRFKERQMLGRHQTSLQRATNRT
jgi:hypothetical protein